MEILDTDRTAIRSVIEYQLRSFQKDDAVAAFSFASPSIQAQFGDANTFVQMVKGSYPAVYRPRSVLFEDVTEVEGQPTQKVVLMDAQGELIRALYLMEKQPDGNWRIHGCILVPMSEKLI